MKQPDVLAKLPPHYLYITGDKPGTGASTACANLAELQSTPEKKAPRISGGSFRRALAYSWQAYLEQCGEVPTQDKWDAFKEFHEGLYQQGGWEAVKKSANSYFGLKSNEQVLKKFNQAQEQFGADDWLWDVILDSYVMAQTHQYPDGYVVDAKLGVAINFVDQLAHLRLPENSIFALPFIYIMLTVDWETAAQRVTGREDTTSVETLELRMKEDWDRYSDIYTINGVPLLLSHLYRLAHAVIDTTHLNEKQEAEAISEVVWEQVQAA
jgi:cytidylate kinase